eukprot:254727-Chlamydomonas_euryale.AAC.10
MSGKSVAVPWMNLLNLCTSVRRRLALLERELHLEDRVREARDLGAVDRQLWVAVPAPGRSTRRTILRVFLDHAHVGVKADAHGRVERDLERGAHVLRANHRTQLLGVDRVEHLGEELDELLLLVFLDRLALLRGLSVHVSQRVVEAVLSIQERHNLVVGQDEALLNRLLALWGNAMQIGKRDVRATTARQHSTSQGEGADAHRSVQSHEVQAEDG